MYYEELRDGVIVWTDNRKNAKVFTGCTETRKVRSGSNVPGAARWKILDAK